MPVGIHPSNVVINKLKLDKDRKALLARRDTHALAEKSKPTTTCVATPLIQFVGKGKFTEADVMQRVD